MPPCVAQGFLQAGRHQRYINALSVGSVNAALCVGDEARHNKAELDVAHVVASCVHTSKISLPNFEAVFYELLNLGLEIRGLEVLNEVPCNFLIFGRERHDK